MVEDIYIEVAGLVLPATLLREANPRIAYCQDRLVLINDENVVLHTIDVLKLIQDEFKKRT